MRAGACLRVCAETVARAFHAGDTRPCCDSPSLTYYLCARRVRTRARERERARLSDAITGPWVINYTLVRLAQWAGTATDGRLTPHGGCSPINHCSTDVSVAAVRLTVPTLKCYTLTTPERANAQRWAALYLQFHQHTIVSLFTKKSVGRGSSGVGRRPSGATIAG